MVKELKDFGVSLQKRTLKNGVNLFLFQRKGMPIYLRTVFFAGSRFDTIPGTSHFLEHMLLAGTKKFPKKNLIAEHIQRVGGEFGASTGTNGLRINVEIPEASDIAVGVEILNEMLNESLFDSNTMETERGSIFSELQSKMSNPKEYVNDVSRRISLQSLPVARSIIGSKEDVLSIDTKALIEYKNQFLTSGRAVFLASGGIEIDTLAEHLENVFLPPSSQFEMGEPLPIVKEEMVDIEKYPGVTELQVIFSCRILPDDYKEYCALKVLSSILGGGRGSRLITKLRYENGLVYAASSFMIDSPDWGIFGVRLSCGKENFDKVKSIVFQEFADLVQNGISESKLVDTKARIIKGSIRHSQTSESWIESHESQALFYPESPKTLGDYIQTVDSLSINDLQKVINKYLKEENFFTAICGDY